MTFALRAFWVVSPNEETPVFDRIFSTVELRAAQTERYQKLFEPREFVKAVLIETGIQESEVFVQSRDSCDKKCTVPAFKISSTGQILEPVVILQHRGLLLCALPLAEDHESSVLEVAQTLDCLHLIAERLSGDLSQRNDLRIQLAKLMAVNFPFGRPQTESAVLTERVIASTLKDMQQDKTKVAIWNPAPSSKNKNNFVVHITEQIHSIKRDEVIATGVIHVTTNEISEMQPEVTMTILHPNPLDIISLAPRAKIENTSDSSTTIKFNPTAGVKLELAHYQTICFAPVEFIISEQKLIVQPSRATLQRLELRIPLEGRKFQISLGTAFEEDGGWLKWDIPVAKIKSKSAEIEIYAGLLGARMIKAEVFFKLSSDLCWSGLRINQGVILINEKAAKIKFLTVAESISGSYFIASAQ
ncbi:uncharacterized protein LOC132198473 [Neocloeon triangulifer]|uniref:uncharacterized protein LOC132198473 n=1 Tax=Neocloeon triangulifer TaxID=2078957 RepID=UPI00286ED3D3|nr:uncharacterized protein LOC132198473 [Neocloeon triangulifer]